MAQPRNWCDEVIDVIQLLGGKAHYNDIYRVMYQRQIMNFEENPHWQAAVRQNIERFSSDSKAYSGKKDIFYSVEGKGSGVWGIREEYLRKNDDVVPQEVLKRKRDLIKQSVRSLSNEELKAKAEEKQTNKPMKRNIKQEAYDRNPYVSEYAKRRANGFCQLCGNAAPFTDKENNPYLETHHVKWLSQNGSDTIDNTVALCPNCHRKMHVVKDKRDVNYLLSSIKEG